MSSKNGSNGAANGRSAVEASPPKFAGFPPPSANFTPAPNAFFDHVLGHYPLRVVTVVGILIRKTLGWTDSITGEKRLEAELPLSAFIRPELSENSARQGLREAIAAGFIVETAARTNREGSRYALRWADETALRERIERQRRAVGDTRPYLDKPGKHQEGQDEQEPADAPSGGAKSGGPKNGPPLSIKKPSLGKEKLDLSNNGKKPLTVTPGDRGGQDGQSATANGEGGDFYKRLILAAVQEAVQLTGDSESTGRWIQLYKICFENNVSGAWTETMYATMRAKERARLQGQKGFNAGRYFNGTCVKELDRRGIPVPKKADLQSPEADEITATIRAALGLPNPVDPAGSASAPVSVPAGVEG